MSYEKFGVPPSEKPDSGENAFNKLMADAQLLEDISFNEDTGVNVESASRLIDRLETIQENDLPFTNEDDAEAREMIMHLEKMQKMFSPAPQEINTALAKLRLIRGKLHAETT